jgi:hypothetical protein
MTMTKELAQQQRPTAQIAEPSEIYKQLFWLVFNRVSDINTGKAASGDFAVQLWRAYNAWLISSSKGKGKGDKQNWDGKDNTCCDYEGGDSVAAVATTADGHIIENLYLTLIDLGCLQALVNGSGCWLDIKIQSDDLCGSGCIQLVELPTWEQRYLERQQQQQ